MMQPSPLYDEEDTSYIISWWPIAVAERGIVERGTVERGIGEFHRQILKSDSSHRTLTPGTALRKNTCTAPRAFEGIHANFEPRWLTGWHSRLCRVMLQPAPPNATLPMCPTLDGWPRNQCTRTITRFAKGTTVGSQVSD